jgi:polygalacturonase
MGTEKLMSKYNVKELGARGDGSLETNILQRIIDECAAAGGGVVYFPAGLYLSGTLTLRSRITLHLENGATLKASPDSADFPAVIEPSEERDTAFLFARGEKSISIIGDGTIDGNGDAFYHVDTPVDETDYDPNLPRQGAAYFKKPYGVEDGPIKPRTVDGRQTRYGTLLLFVECEDLSFRDFNIVGSPNWCLHLAGCKYAAVHSLNVRNSLLVPNADCIDVSNSQNIRITNCHLEGGDDGIAISPCGDGYAMMDACHITVSNCTIISRSSAIRIGPGVTRLSNCVFSNLVIHSTNRALGIFVRNKQIIENLLFSDIVIETRLHTGWWGAGEPIHISAVPGYYAGDHSMGVIRNVRFRNITARGENGILLYAVDHPDLEFPLQDITLEDVRLEIVNSRLNERFGGNIDLRPAHESRYQVFASDLPGVYARRVKGLSIRNFQLIWGEGLPEFFTHGIGCEKCEDVRIENFSGTACHSGEAVHMEN